MIPVIVRGPAVPYPVGMKRRNVLRLAGVGLAGWAFLALPAFADVKVRGLQEKGKVSLFGSLLARLEGNSP